MTIDSRKAPLPRCFYPDLTPMGKSARRQGAGLPPLIPAKNKKALICLYPSAYLYLLNTQGRVYGIGSTGITGTMGPGGTVIRLLFVTRLPPLVHCIILYHVFYKNEENEKG